MLSPPRPLCLHAVLWKKRPRSLQPPPDLGCMVGEGGGGLRQSRLPPLHPRGGFCIQIKFTSHDRPPPHPLPSGSHPPSPPPTAPQGREGGAICRGRAGQAHPPILPRANTRKLIIGPPPVWHFCGAWFCTDLWRACTDLRMVLHRSVEGPVQILGWFCTGLWRVLHRS